MYRANPYRPGAGLIPMYLSGRDEDIAETTEIFDALRVGVPVQSVIFSALRGVGKRIVKIWKMRYT